MVTSDWPLSSLVVGIWPKVGSNFRVSYPHRIPVFLSHVAGFAICRHCTSITERQFCEILKPRVALRCQFLLIPQLILGMNVHSQAVLGRLDNDLYYLQNAED